MRRLAIFGIAALLIAAGAALYRYFHAAPPKLTLALGRFDQLSGWGEDHVAAVLPAFRKSCGVITARADTAAFDPGLKTGDFGTVGDWRQLCATVETLAGDAAARAFFEANFVPLLAGNNSDRDGLFTGYYEIMLSGSRRREGPYQHPIYRRPPDPKAYSRADIDDGAFKDKGLELVWVNDAIAAYFLQIQGSGIVRLPNGKTVRLGYDGGNGRPFVSVGRLLVERSEVPLKDMTMQRLREWIEAHGAAGTALMREDPSYVFFKEISGDGPYGSEHVVLTPERSLAVDHRFIPLGMPLWLEATQRFTDGAIRRAVIAQDTGGAIKGPVRGDFYWGSGDAAGRMAGAMNATGRYALLVPKAVSARAIAAAGGGD